MSKSYLDELKRLMDKPPIKWMENADAKAEIIEEGHVKIILNVDPMHKNHVNTVYAGSMFAFAEMGGGALIQSLLGFDKWVPIIKCSSIKYLKPTQDNLVVDLSMSSEELAEKMEPIEERGKGDFIIVVPIYDVNGVCVAKAEMNYYLLPFTKDMMGKK